MFTLKRVLEKQKQQSATRRFVGLWPILIHRAYGPKFFQLEKSININITHDYLASNENEPCGRATYLFDVRHVSTFNDHCMFGLVGPFLD